MKIKSTKFNGLKIIDGLKFSDKRGYFREIYKKKIFSHNELVFWCMSKSKKNVIRGMHLQKKFMQEKYVSVIKGKILDVVVDLRHRSKTFGKVYSVILSEKNCKSVFIPAGFAHGFCGLEKENIIFYGNSNYRSAKNEISLSWNDKNLKIKWPTRNIIQSKKDSFSLSFKEFVEKKIKL
jgi:dTDP-4-dehydrorhamnose 3,5-epimerase